MTGRGHGALTAAAAGMLAVIAALGLSMSMSQNTEIQMNEPPVTIHSARLHRVEGRSVTMEFEATRHRSCALSVTTQWRGPTGIVGSRHNPNKATLEDGETARFRLEAELPKWLAPGAYMVRSVGEYACEDGRVFIVPAPWVEVALK